MRRFGPTWLIFVCALALLTIGIVMVFSSSAAIAKRNVVRAAVEAQQSQRSILESDPSQASIHSAYYLNRQIPYALIGLLALVCCYAIDYNWYRRLATPLLIFSAVLLICVFLPGIGVKNKGSHRWINLRFMMLQASEVAKVAAILYFAKKLTDRQKEIRSLVKTFIPCLLILGALLGLILIEPDLGTAFMIACAVFAMMFVAGVRLTHLGTLAAAAPLLIAGAIIQKPYRMQRIFAYLDPEADKRGGGWQLFESLLTISTGGLAGLGLGQGQQKYQFLAEAYTDFIYAVICEEFGMRGGLVVFCLYAVLMVQGLRVAYRANDMYQSLLATGITCMISLQAFVNMAVVTGLIPTKGLTLPLISFGGSSLVINCVAVGILMNVSRQVEIETVPARISGVDAKGGRGGRGGEGGNRREQYA